MNLIYDLTDPEKVVTPAGPPAWLAAVVDGMRLHGSSHLPKPPVRVKRIDVHGHTAFLLKNAGNRRRIILMSRGHEVVSTASIPNRVTAGSPYIPLYPEDYDPRCEKQRWPITEAGLVALSKYCAEKMEEKTYWSDPSTIDRIPLSREGIGGFVFGKIVSASPVVRDSVPYWVIRFVPDHDNFALPPLDAFQVMVKQSAIRYESINPGYNLIYKSEDEADIASDGELMAYTRLVS